GIAIGVHRVLYVFDVGCIYDGCFPGALVWNFLPDGEAIAGSRPSASPDGWYGRRYGTSAEGTFGLLGAVSAGSAFFVGRRTDLRGAERTVLVAIVMTLTGYVVLALGRTLAGLIAGIVLGDVGVQAGHVANQSRIYRLVPTARARLNTFYMVAFFTG